MSTDAHELSTGRCPPIMCTGVHGCARACHRHFPRVSKDCRGGVDEHPRIPMNVHGCQRVCTVMSTRVSIDCQGLSTNIHGFPRESIVHRRSTFVHGLCTDVHGCPGACPRMPMHRPRMYTVNCPRMYRCPRACTAMSTGVDRLSKVLDGLSTNIYVHRCPRMRTNCPRTYAGVESFHGLAVDAQGLSTNVLECPPLCTGIFRGVPRHTHHCPQMSIGVEGCLRLVVNRRHTDVHNLSTNAH